MAVRTALWDLLGVVRTRESMSSLRKGLSATGFSATLPLVPAVIDAVGDIPIVAAGGIADGRGVAAALMLGAAGAWLGSRFVASVESGQPDWIKHRAVAGGTDDAVRERPREVLGGWL